MIWPDGHACIKGPWLGWRQSVGEPWFPMGPSKILGGCDVRSQEFVPVQSCHISCQLAMSQSEYAYSAIADWHWTTSNTPEVAIRAPYGDMGTSQRRNGDVRTWWHVGKIGPWGQTSEGRFSSAQAEAEISASCGPRRTAACDTTKGPTSQESRRVPGATAVDVGALTRDSHAAPHNDGDVTGLRPSSRRVCGRWAAAGSAHRPGEERVGADKLHRPTWRGRSCSTTWRPCYNATHEYGRTGRQTERSETVESWPSSSDLTESPVSSNPRRVTCTPQVPDRSYRHPDSFAISWIT